MNVLPAKTPLRVVVSEWMDLEAVDRLRETFDVLYAPELVDDPVALQSALKTADALIVRNRTQVTASMLEHGAKLRVVGRLGVGLDNIDLDTCRRRGIDVCPAYGANARSVAEYTVCCAMMLLRGMFLNTEAVTAGAWPRQALASGRETMGKTLGVIGHGSVGRATSALALALGLHVAYWDRQEADREQSAGSAQSSAARSLSSLDELLAVSDIVSLHIPLNDETRRLLGAEELQKMKPGAILINVARGGVIDEAAVAAALRSGHLGGAAIDVFEEEPLSKGSVWNGCPNLILTPHVAGLSVESNLRVAHAVANAVTQRLAA